jgi:hypothetical protein
MGTSLCTTICLSLLLQVLQPTSIPYGFPLGYGPPFICGLIAARHLKRAKVQFDQHPSAQADDNQSHLKDNHWIIKHLSRRVQSAAVSSDGCIALCIGISVFHGELLLWLGLDFRICLTPLLAAFLIINARSGSAGIVASFLQLPLFDAICHCTFEIFIFQAPLYRLLTRCFNLPDWYTRFTTSGHAARTNPIPFITYLVFLCITSALYASYIREPLSRLTVDSIRWLQRSRSVIRSLEVHLL